MSVFRRAWLYITRKRGRSVLLFMIMLVMAVFSMLGLAIKASADKEAAAVRKSLASSFAIARNEEAIDALVNKNGGAANISPDILPIVSAEAMSRIVRLDHVTGYYAQYLDRGTGLPYVSAQLRPGINADILRRYRKNHASFDNLPSDLDQTSTWMHIPEICYCNDSSLHAFFRNGAFTLREGRHLREGDVHKAVISADLARRNDLSVGDTITVEKREAIWDLAGGDYNKIVGEPIELEIVGLFDINFSQEASFTTDTSGETYVQTFEQDFAENFIFSDQATELYFARLFRAFTGQTVSAAFEEAPRQPVIFVDDPENLEAVIAEVKALGAIDWDYFYIIPDDSTYKAAAGPLRQLGTVSAVLVAAAVVGCAAVLGLTLNMWTKSRKHEMGILMSLGVSRRQLALQLLLESLTIAVAALLLSAAVSAALTGPVGDLANRFASPAGTGDAYDIQRDSVSWEIVIDRVAADPVDLTYGLGALNVLITAAAVLGATALSVAVPARRIMKLKPKADLRAM